MATGVVSVAASHDGYSTLSTALLWTAVAGFASLVALAGRHVGRDLADPRTAFDSFAFVAAAGILGARLGIGGHLDAALGFWLLALGAWLALVAAVPAVGLRGQRRLLAGAGASWLLAVVATQSLAVLGIALAARWDRQPLLVAALALWLLGLALYAVVVWAAGRSLGRGPDVWIVMGALAISTLAAAELLEAARESALLTALHPVVKGLVLAVWSAGSLLVPALAAWELRFGERGYTTKRWATVFPLGMYAAATHALGNALAFHPLVRLGRDFLWVALAAWALAALGLARRGLAGARA